MTKKVRAAITSIEKDLKELSHTTMSTAFYGFLENIIILMDYVRKYRRSK